VEHRVAKIQKTQSDQLRLLDLPDAIFSVIFGWLTPLHIRQTRQFKNILSFRCVCRRTNRWFENLPIATNLFYAVMNRNDDVVIPYGKRLSDCRMPNRVREFNDSEMYMDDWKLSILVQICPNVTALRLELRGKQECIEKVVPGLEKLSLVNNHNVDDSDDDGSHPNDESNVEFSFPVLPRLKSLAIYEGTRPFNMRFDEVFRQYPMLQELRIPDVDASLHASCILPPYLKVLECPLWMFSVARKKPGSVIERLRPVVDDDDQHLQKQPRKHVFGACSADDECVTINVLEMDTDGFYHLGVISILMACKVNWHTLEMENGNPGISLSHIITSCLCVKSREFIRRFAAVEMQPAQADADAVSIAMNVYVACYRAGDAMSLWGTTRLRIHGKDSTRGPCTVVWLPEHNMCEIRWDDHPCTRSCCKWCP